MVHHGRHRPMPNITLYPRCPKCESSRTEVIGMSTDLKTTYVRCSDCGARSQVPARDSREAVIAR
jgi:transcription elongation factor Elf1